MRKPDPSDPSVAFSVDLVNAALTELPRHRSALTFLRWAQESWPEAFPRIFTAKNPEYNKTAAYWMARGLWNNAPLPANKFRPKPLPEPKRNAPCPCGSGRKHKACCARSPSSKTPSLNLWSEFVPTQPEEYWLQVASQLPMVGVSAVGAWLLERERWKPLVELLEPRFKEGQRITTEHAGLLHGLGEAYMELDNSAKQDALLARLVECPNKSVRAEANLRLATLLHVRNDFDGAWSAWRKAEKIKPNSYTVGLIELGLLSDEKQYERVERRADFWLSRLQDNPDVSEKALNTIRSFGAKQDVAFNDDADDGVLLSKDLQAALDDFLDWILAALERPLPDLEWQALKNVDDTLRGACMPVVDTAATALEGGWRERTAAETPYSIDMTSEQDVESLTRIADWLPWLKDHPQALDSFCILDDLMRMLIIVEDIVTAAEDCANDLSDRGFDMLAKHWPDQRAGTTPWVIEANRPALRLLANGIYNEHWGGQRESMIRLYLRLSPNDNHGFRTEFIDRLLADGEDAEAVEVASRYPTDMYAEVAYGGVLGLYRLKRLADAEAALASALERLPKVADYLLAEEAAEPESDSRGLAIGGDRQAWLYRRTMRDEWLKTTSALDWLAAVQQAGPRLGLRRGARNWLTDRRKAVQVRLKGKP